jgi:hypothetical protein
LRTKKRRFILSLVVGSVIVAAVILTVNARARFDGSNSTLAQFRNAYERPPKLLLAYGEIRFAPLDDAQLSRVRITPTVAIRVASSQFGRDHGSRVTFESLGGYIDANRIVHDWVGTRSWVPKALPAYIVRISGVQIELNGPPGGVAKNRSWNVIVNAIDGRVISAMTYN